MGRTSSFVQVSPQHTVCESPATTVPSTFADSKENQVHKESKLCCMTAFVSAVLHAKLGGEEKEKEEEKGGRGREREVGLQIEG